MAIIGYPACKAELERRLSAIKARLDALPAGNEDALTAAVVDGLGQLSDFEADSLPENMSDSAEVAAIAKLDDLSKRTRGALSLQGLSKIIAGIRARADELAALAETLDEQTAANLSAEKKLRLVPIRNAIVSATATVEAFKVLKKSLRQNNRDEAAILANLDMLIAQFGDLKQSLNNAGVSV
jgi:hypothetical protein